MSSSIPSNLLCPLCDDLLASAVITSCCGSFACQECAEAELTTFAGGTCWAGDNCPGAIDIILTPDETLRKRIEQFQTQKDYFDDDHQLLECAGGLKEEDDSKGNIVEAKKLKREAKERCSNVCPDSTFKLNFSQGEKSENDFEKTEEQSEELTERSNKQLPIKEKKKELTKLGGSQGSIESIPTVEPSCSKCFLCHSVEHVTKDCPTLLDKACKRCNMKGHLAFKCPMKKRRKRKEACETEKQIESETIVIKDAITEHITEVENNIESEIVVIEDAKAEDTKGAENEMEPEKDQYPDMETGHIEETGEESVTNREVVSSTGDNLLTITINNTDEICEETEFSELTTSKIPADIDSDSSTDKEESGTEVDKMQKRLLSLLSTLKELKEGRNDESSSNSETEVAPGDLRNKLRKRKYIKKRSAAELEAGRSKRSRTESLSSALSSSSDAKQPSPSSPTIVGTDVSKSTGTEQGNGRELESQNDGADNVVAPGEDEAIVEGNQPGLELCYCETDDPTQPCPSCPVFEVSCQFGHIMEAAVKAKRNERTARRANYLTSSRVLPHYLPISSVTAKILLDDATQHLITKSKEGTLMRVWPATPGKVSKYASAITSMLKVPPQFKGNVKIPITTRVPARLTNAMSLEDINMFKDTSMLVGRCQFYKYPTGREGICDKAFIHKDQSIKFVPPSGVCDVMLTVSDNSFLKLSKSVRPMAIIDTSNFLIPLSPKVNFSKAKRSGESMNKALLSLTNLANCDTMINFTKGSYFGTLVPLYPLLKYEERSRQTESSLANVVCSCGAGAPCSSCPTFNVYCKSYDLPIGIPRNTSDNICIVPVYIHLDIIPPGLVPSVVVFAWPTEGCSDYVHVQENITLVDSLNVTGPTIKIKLPIVINSGALKSRTGPKHVRSKIGKCQFFTRPPFSMVTCAKFNIDRLTLRPGETSQKPVMLSVGPHVPLKSGSTVHVHLDLQQQLRTLNAVYKVEGKFDVQGIEAVKSIAVLLTNPVNSDQVVKLHKGESIGYAFPFEVKDEKNTSDDYSADKPGTGASNNVLTGDKHQNETVSSTSSNCPDKPATKQHTSNKPTENPSSITAKKSSRSIDNNNTFQPGGVESVEVEFERDLIDKGSQQKESREVKATTFDRRNNMGENVINIKEHTVSSQKKSHVKYSLNGDVGEISNKQNSKSRNDSKTNFSNISDKEVQMVDCRSEDVQSTSKSSHRIENALPGKSTINTNDYKILENKITESNKQDITLVEEIPGGRQNSGTGVQKGESKKNSAQLEVGALDKTRTKSTKGAAVKTQHDDEEDIQILDEVMVVKNMNRKAPTSHYKSKGEVQILEESPFLSVGASLQMIVDEEVKCHITMANIKSGSLLSTKVSAVKEDRSHVKLNNDIIVKVTSINSDKQKLIRPLERLVLLDKNGSCDLTLKCDINKNNPKKKNTITLYKLEKIANCKIMYDKETVIKITALLGKWTRNIWPGCCVSCRLTLLYDAKKEGLFEQLEKSSVILNLRQSKPLVLQDDLIKIKKESEIIFADVTLVNPLNSGTTVNLEPGEIGTFVFVEL